MKLAVATNDKETISKDYFKDSNYYLVYEILNGKIVSEELRENRSSGESNLNANEQMDQILDLLKDCTIFLGKQMDKKSLTSISSQNIDVIITTKENVNETVSSFLEPIDDYFQYYDFKSGKFVTCKDRLLR